MIKLTEILQLLLEEEKKKKADRCKRIADRRYDKPSAYKSGAIVRCRQGKIWKDLKEEDLNEDESLHKWFKRKGTPGKEGESRAKYPLCRPTPAQCKTKGKGKKWGKTK